MWHTYTTEFYSAMKKNKIFRKINETGKYSIKWNNTDTNINVHIILSYVDPIFKFLHLYAYFEVSTKVMKPKDNNDNETEEILVRECTI